MIIRILVLTLLLFVGLFLIYEEKDKISSMLGLSNQLEKKILPQFKKIDHDFYSLFEKDMEIIKNQLGSHFFKVRSIDWNIRDPEIEIEKLKNRRSFEIAQSSVLDLEIEIFSQPGEKSKMTIMQFSFTDNLSKNKVYEFGRMYEINDKKKPD